MSITLAFRFITVVIEYWSGQSQSISSEMDVYGGPSVASAQTERRARRWSAISIMCPSHSALKYDCYQTVCIVCW